MKTLFKEGMLKKIQSLESEKEDHGGHDDHGGDHGHGHGDGHGDGGNDLTHEQHLEIFGDKSNLHLHQTVIEMTILCFLKSAVTKNHITI